jgi:hypothetical protein
MCELLSYQMNRIESEGFHTNRVTRSLNETGFSLLRGLSPVALYFRVTVETGLSDDEADTAAYEKMKKCSPVTRLSSVVAPTLLLVGTKDKRVPSSQSIHYYNSLLSNNVQTKYGHCFRVLIYTLKGMLIMNCEGLSC